jgi:Spy/CpxP family protein refolding chaperone
MKKTLVTLLALALGVSAFAAAPPHRQAPGQGQGQAEGERQGGDVLPPRALAAFLGLTEAQVEQTQAIRESMRTAIEPLREQIHVNRDLMQAALEAGDAAKAGQLALANFDLRKQIEAARESADTQFQALLTAEQKAKWDVYQQILEARRRHGRRD